MATAKYKASDLRVVPVGAGYGIATIRGMFVTSRWFETAGEARDFIVREFA